MSGFFQIFLIIYFPVWVDKFGEERKTLWLTYLQLAVVMGVVFGYVVTAVFNVLHGYYEFFSWRCSFYLQFFLLIGSFVFFLRCEEVDLATNGVFKVIENDDDDNFKNFPVRKFSFQSSPSFIYDQAIDFDLEEISDINFSEDNTPKKTKKKKKTKKTKKTITQTLRQILKKRLFILSMLSLCSLYFIITAIQFWISDYMITILNFQKKTVFIIFTIISTTAPSLGLTLGGKICTKIGGYTSKHCILFCLTATIISSLFSIPIPFLNNKIIIIILFWFLLFFGASVLPALLGIMISSIPNESRNLGNAFAQFMFNLFGYFPSPILYGFVNSLDSSMFIRKTESLGDDYGRVLAPLGSRFFGDCAF